MPIGYLKPEPLSQTGPTISAGELRAIPHVVLKDDRVGFKLGGTRFNNLDQLVEAISYHGFYGKKAREQGEPVVVVSLKDNLHQLAIEQLKKADADYRGGAGAYGFGPNQNSLTLDIAQACKAQRSLKNGGVTSQEAKILLDWITQKTRNALAKSQNHESPNEYSGSCGYAQGIIGHQCEGMNINVQYHQVKSLSPNSVMWHAFNVLTLPVRNNISGAIEDKHYLVDTTFKQFFNCKFEGVNTDSTMESWGARLTETPEGREMADALLRHGFVELTDQNARLYVETQVAAHNAETKHYDELAWEIRSPLENLAGKSTTVNDYKREELKGIDVLSPEMMISMYSRSPEARLENSL
jgi:hypothetical protein